MCRDRDSRIGRRVAAPTLGVEGGELGEETVGHEARKRGKSAEGVRRRTTRWLKLDGLKSSATADLRLSTSALLSKAVQTNMC